MKEEFYVLHTDGGSRGNPGKAAAGWVIYSPNKQIISKGSKFLGIKTNNFAEYTAIIEGIKECLEKKISYLIVRMDSELAVKQINGLYKIKNAQIKLFTDEIFILRKNFKKIVFTHVYRENNTEADKMVNICLDLKKY